MTLSNVWQRRGRVGVMAIVVSAAAVTACQKSETTRAGAPRGYQQQMRAENERERQEFIQDTQERISDLDREIAQLETHMDHESEFISVEERAGWKEDLFELRREREDAQARLDRARTASPAEWQASRNDVSLQMDRLEAGIQTLGNRISRAFSGQPDIEGERVPVGGDETEPEMDQSPYQAPDDQNMPPPAPVPRDPNMSPPPGSGTDPSLPRQGGDPAAPPGGGTGPSDFGY